LALLCALGNLAVYEKVLAHMQFFIRFTVKKHEIYAQVYVNEFKLLELILKGLHTNTKFSKHVGI